MHGRNVKTLFIGLTSILLWRKDLSSIKHDRTQSSFATHSQLIVSRRLSWWELQKSFTRKYMRHLGLLQRFPWKIIGWKNWVQKLLEVVKTPNRPNPKPKTQLLSTERPVESCVPVSGERLDQDKDADENVDADQIRTVRPVKSGQSYLFVRTARGNSHWLQSVRITTCSCERSRNRIESHPHREALQADLSRITSTTHSVTIRKQWSVKCAM